MDLSWVPNHLIQLNVVFIGLRNALHGNTYTFMTLCSVRHQLSEILVLSVLRSLSEVTDFPWQGCDVIFPGCHTLERHNWLWSSVYICCVNISQWCDMKTLTPWVYVIQNFTIFRIWYGCVVLWAKYDLHFRGKNLYFTSYSLHVRTDQSLCYLHSFVWNSPGDKSLASFIYLFIFLHFICKWVLGAIMQRNASTVCYTNRREKKHEKRSHQYRLFFLKKNRMKERKHNVINRQKKKNSLWDLDTKIQFE